MWPADAYRMAPSGPARSQTAVAKRALGVLRIPRGQHSVVDPPRKLVRWQARLDAVDEEVEGRGGKTGAHPVAGDIRDPQEQLVIFQAPAQEISTQVAVRLEHRGDPQRAALGKMTRKQVELKPVAQPQRRVHVGEQVRPVVEVQGARLLGSPAG